MNNIIIKSLKLFYLKKNILQFLEKIDNCLGFEIETNNSIELRNLWKKDIFKVINGKYNERPIVLINSYTRKTSKNKITLKIDIMIDGFIIGKNTNNKKIIRKNCKGTKLLYSS